VRQEFNTPEGAALARKNSIMMAERRAQEKLARDASRAASGSVVAAAPQALAAHDESPLAMTANLVRRVSLTLGKDVDAEPVGKELHGKISRRMSKTLGKDPEKIA